MAKQEFDTVHGQVAQTINNYTENKHSHHHAHQHTHHHAHTHHGPLVLRTTVVQQAPDFALQAPPAPQARYRQRNRQVVQPITPAQKELLAMMRPLSKPVRNALLEWMRAELGTGLVMELDAVELHQVRQRVLEARRAAGI